MKKGPLVVPSGCLSARARDCPPTIGICSFSSFFSSRARFSGLWWGGVGCWRSLALASCSWCHVTDGLGLGWGGDDNVPCTCTHVRCYAIGCFFLHLHTYLMLRHRMFLVGWGGDDDVPCTCTHVCCYAIGWETKALRAPTTIRNVDCLGYIGDYTTQLCGDHFINHEIRIPDPY